MGCCGEDGGSGRRESWSSEVDAGAGIFDGGGVQLGFWNWVFCNLLSLNFAEQKGDSLSTPLSHLIWASTLLQTSKVHAFNLFHFQNCW